MSFSSSFKRFVHGVGLMCTFAGLAGLLNGKFILAAALLFGAAVCFGGARRFASSINAIQSFDATIINRHPRLWATVYFLIISPVAFVGSYVGPFDQQIAPSLLLGLFVGGLVAFLVLRTFESR